MLCSKLPCSEVFNLSEGKMPSRDTYPHMLSVIAEGARQVQVMMLMICTGYGTEPYML